MEIVRLEAIDDRCAFAHAAILEFQDCHARGGVFVFHKILVERVRGITADHFHVFAHAQEQRVQRVAAGQEQAAAAGLFLGVPAILAIPRADAVIIIDLDRKSTRLNSSHIQKSRMPSSA